MNQHEHTLNLLRNHRHLTPAQQLEVIELSATQHQKRAKSTRRILGVGALCAITYFGAIVAPTLALGGLVLGVAGALFWIWGRSADETRSITSPVEDANTIREIDERLANLEAILNYEEKIAARHRDSAAE